MDGSSNYRIHENKFEGELGVESRSNGTFLNSVFSNEFLSNRVGLITQEENSGYNFYENCFSSLSGDVLILGQIKSEIRGENANPANNCFTHMGQISSFPPNVPFDIAGNHVPFEYFEPDNSSGLDCRDAFQAGPDVIRTFSLEQFENNCDNSIENIENLDDSDFQDSLENGNFDIVERLLIDSDSFEDKQKLFRLKLTQGDFDAGRYLLNSLADLNEGQLDWIQISLIYLDMLEQYNEQELNADELNADELNETISKIAMKDHSYSGYAQSLYFLRTNTFVDNLDLSFLNRFYVEERRLDKKMQNYTKKIQFYPNPTSNILIVENGSEIREMNIYNSLGESVFTFNGESSIDTKRISNGIYWIRFENLNGIQMVEKLIITK